MSKRSADVLVEDIREAIAKIGRFTNGMTHESFIADEKDRRCSCSQSRNHRPEKQGRA
jgi:uncharacterized protein with HEPN domain